MLENASPSTGIRLFVVFKKRFLIKGLYTQLNPITINLSRSRIVPPEKHVLVAEFISPKSVHFHVCRDRSCPKHVKRTHSATKILIPGSRVYTVWAPALG